MDISQLRFGPDVNGYWPVRDWGKLVATGATFFGAKACEGAHTVDCSFAGHRDGFRQHFGADARAVWYTMFHCEKDPSAQAELLADTVGPLDPRETLCCDFEGTSYAKLAPDIVHAHGLQYLEAFYARLDSLGVLKGARPMIYTSARHWQMMGSPDWDRAAEIDLWVPRYHSPDPCPPDVLPKPWAQAGWTVLQWTDNKTGIHAPLDGVGACDMNVLSSGTCTGFVRESETKGTP
jgi:GH25 family lysozyme M1 (1,4-beta-N-acetylmuramidase)